MRTINNSNNKASTILAFCLIPITGFALDIYIPSLPDMSAKLNANPAAIQFTIAIFLGAYGFGQLLIGGVVDSFGRYIPNLIGLAGFIIASLVIATSVNLQLIYFIRAVQGISSAAILVSKRAYFFDLFSGEKLKHYTSLFSVFWSAAPIIAPFIGGFLQSQFGWHANFYFLACLGGLFLILEIILSGETIKTKTPFRIKIIGAAYIKMILTRDFTAGFLILGLSYGVLMVYNMSSPFLIEKLMHFAPTVTGRCSMISGIAFLAGSMLSNILIAKRFLKKMLIAVIMQLILTGCFILITFNVHNLYSLIGYVIFISSCAGFILNGTLAYCLSRFSQYGGMLSGLLGGAYIIFTSTFSFIIVKTIKIDTQSRLGEGCEILIMVLLILLLMTKWNDFRPKKG